MMFELTPVDGLPMPSRIAEALRHKNCPSDRLFDSLLPYGLRVVSSQYWTPLPVAVRVADWFEQLGVRTAVDIGSGAGKFCVAAALAGNVQVVGLEQRQYLVTAARELANLFGLSDRVSFIHGTLGETPVPAAEAYYLYNPFGENIFPRADRLDDTVELGDERYLRDIDATEALLRNAPIGTFLVTYNGFGGGTPAGYREVRVDRELRNVLHMSQKVSA